MCLLFFVLVILLVFQCYSVEIGNSLLAAESDPNVFSGTIAIEGQLFKAAIRAKSKSIKSMPGKG